MSWRRWVTNDAGLIISEAPGDRGLFKLVLYRGGLPAATMEIKKASELTEAFFHGICNNLVLAERKYDLQMMITHIGRLLYLRSVRKYISHITLFDGHGRLKVPGVIIIGQFEACINCIETVPRVQAQVCFRH